MHFVFSGLGIGMMHFTALQRDAVAEIPVIGQHHITVPAVGSKCQRGSRVAGGGVVRRYGGSSCRHVGIDYFQYAHGMRRLIKDHGTGG